MRVFFRFFSILVISFLVGVLFIARSANAGSFPATVDLATLNVGDGFSFRAFGVDTSLVRIAAVGDINNDGIGDMAVGLPMANPGGMLAQAGQTYVIFGKTGGFTGSVDLLALNGSVGFVINGVAAGAKSGWAISPAGDVNGDGIDDMVIGAPFASIGSKSNAGMVYVVFGKTGAFTPVLELSSLDGNAGFTLKGNALGDAVGISVAAAGDINGDGMDDIIVGAANADPSNRVDAGAAYVVFGKPTGFSASIKLSSLDGISGFSLNGAAANDAAGKSVAGAGDVNGDGIDDLLVGAPGASPGGRPFAGTAYVIFGHTGIFTPTFDLAAVDGANGFALNGAAYNDAAGISVSSAGDINGDRIADVIIGANMARSNRGEAYVVFGKTTGFGGKLELSQLSLLSTGGQQSGFTVRGKTNNKLGISVAHAGDVNRDGLDDIIIGAPFSFPTLRSNQGGAYVIYGNNNGYPPLISTDFTFFNGANGFVIAGALNGDALGMSVSGGIDINDDGVVDIFTGGESVSGLSGATVFGVTAEISDVSPDVGQTTLFSSVLPSARSGYLGGPAITVFLSVINAGVHPALNCSIVAPVGVLPVSLDYQQTNPANIPFGSLNAPFDIGIGQTLSFVLALTPVSVSTGQNIFYNIVCDQTSVSEIPSVNTVFISVDDRPVSDILSIGATPSNDGIIKLPVNGISFMTASAINIGVGDVAGSSDAAITVSVDTGNQALPLDLQLCETDAQSICTSALGASVSTVIGSTPKFFAMFVTDQSNGTIALDAATKRAFMSFKDNAGIIRSITSSAVASEAPKPMNLAPILSNAVNNQEAVVGLSFRIDTSQGDTTFSDPDGDVLTYSIRMDRSDVGFSVSNTEVLGVGTEESNITVTIIATDPGGLSASTSFNLKINSSTLSGKFIDTYVEGLNYIIGGVERKTSAAGVFNYLPSEKVSFSVGAIQLGELLAQDIVHVFDLESTVERLNGKSIRIGQFLQSLDEDGELSNGIQIADTTHELLTSSSIDFDADEAKYNNQLEAAMTLLGKTAVTQVAAQAHLVESKERIDCLFPEYKDFFQISDPNCADRKRMHYYLQVVRPVLSQDQKMLMENFHALEAVTADRTLENRIIAFGDAVVSGVEVITDSVVNVIDTQPSDDDVTRLRNAAKVLGLLNSSIDLLTSAMAVKYPTEDYLELRGDATIIVDLILSTPGCIDYINSTNDDAKFSDCKKAVKSGIKAVGRIPDSAKLEGRVDAALKAFDTILALPDAMVGAIDILTTDGFKASSVLAGLKFVESAYESYYTIYVNEVGKNDTIIAANLGVENFFNSAQCLYGWKNFKAQKDSGLSADAIAGSINTIAADCADAIVGNITQITQTTKIVLGGGIALDVGRRYNDQVMVQAGLEEYLAFGHRNLARALKWGIAGNDSTWTQLTAIGQQKDLAAFSNSILDRILFLRFKEFNLTYTRNKVLFWADVLDRIEASENFDLDSILEITAAPEGNLQDDFQVTYSYSDSRRRPLRRLECYASDTEFSRTSPLILENPAIQGSFILNFSVGGRKTVVCRSFGDTGGATGANSISPLIVEPEPDVADPEVSISRISPTIAFLNEPTKFTVVGKNLPISMSFQLTECFAQSIESSSSLRKIYECTPSNTVGMKTGLLTDNQGNILMNFTVEFQQRVVEPFISRVSPLAAVFSQATTFTVTGTDLPSTLAFFIPDCADLTTVSRGATEQQFRCTPSLSTGTKNGVVKVKQGPNETVLKEFSVVVSEAIPDSIVLSISPLTATLNEVTNFTVTGTDLQSTLAFFIPDCANLRAVSRGKTEQQFRCTPSFSAGTKNGVVKNVSGGTVLKEFNVVVAEPTPDPVVMSVSPLTATLNQATTFTVIGTDMPSTLAFFIPDCADLTTVSRGASEQQFRCTPSLSAGTKNGVVKNVSGGTVLKEFSVVVTEAISDPVVSGVSPLTATLNEATTFTVTGTDLPSTLAFLIADCADLTTVSRGTSQQQFRCTPQSPVGVKSGRIDDKPSGTQLFGFDIRVSAPEPVPVISDLFPLKAKLDVATTFTITGGNLPDTLTMQFPDCLNVTFVNRTSLRQQFTCTPSGSIGFKSAVVTVQRQGKSDIAKSFQVEFEVKPRDPVVTVTVNPVIEGSEMVFVFDLDNNSTFSRVDITYQIDGGTATEGVDFAEKSGSPTLSLRSDSRQATVRVQTLGDGAVEGDETVKLEILNVSGGVANETVIFGTIQDDDVVGGVPQVYLNAPPSTITEGGSIRYVLNGDVTQTNNDLLIEWTVLGDVSIDDIESIEVVDFAKDSFGSEQYRTRLFTGTKTVQMRFPKAMNALWRNMIVTVKTKDDSLVEQDEILWMFGRILSGTAIFNEQSDRRFGQVTVQDND